MTARRSVERLAGVDRAHGGELRFQESGILPNGEEDSRASDDNAPFSALAFKIMNDPFVGTLTFARIYSGTLETASQVMNSVKDKKEKGGRMLLMHANDREDIQVAYAGDIVALAGLKDTTTGDTLCAINAPITPALLQRDPVDLAGPEIGVPVRPGACRRHQVQGSPHRPGGRGPHRHPARHGPHRRARGDMHHVALLKALQLILLNCAIAAAYRTLFIAFFGTPEEMAALCLQCSEKERRADEAQREVDERYRSAWMEQHVGSEFDGVVSGVTSFGLNLIVLEPGLTLDPTTDHAILITTPPVWEDAWSTATPLTCFCCV